MTDYGITLDASAWLSNQGRFGAGKPEGVVVHTLECEAKPRIAEELSARGGYLDNQGLAPQRMTDPVSIVRTIPDGCVGGHVGGRGNPRFVGVEVSGRAGWKRGQWLDGGRAQAALSNSARAAAGLFIIYGHGYDEIRWLSGAQIQARNVFGLLGHIDVSTFVGGTNHWDPGLPEDFPYEWYCNEVRRWFLVMTGGTAAPQPPAPSRPTAPSQPTAPSTDWFDDMATRKDLDDALYAMLTREDVITNLAREVMKELAGYTDNKYPYSAQARAKIAEAVKGSLSATIANVTDVQGRILPRGARWDMLQDVQSRLRQIADKLGIAPHEPMVAPPAPAATHKVAKGDTLTKIAAANKTTAAELAKLNGIALNAVIEVGQVLKVRG